VCGRRSQIGTRGAVDQREVPNPGNAGPTRGPMTSRRRAMTPESPKDLKSRFDPHEERSNEYPIRFMSAPVKVRPSWPASSR
jgi:hypothetical protein